VILDKQKNLAAQPVNRNLTFEHKRLLRWHTISMTMMFNE